MLKPHIVLITIWSLVIPVGCKKRGHSNSSFKASEVQYKSSSWFKELQRENKYAAQRLGGMFEEMMQTEKDIGAVFYYVDQGRKIDVEIDKLPQGKKVYFKVQPDSAYSYHSRMQRSQNGKVLKYIINKFNNEDLSTPKDFLVLNFDYSKSSVDLNAAVIENTQKYNSFITKEYSTVQFGTETINQRKSGFAIWATKFAIGGLLLTVALCGAMFCLAFPKTAAAAALLIISVTVFSIIKMYRNRDKLPKKYDDDFVRLVDISHGVWN